MTTSEDYIDKYGSARVLAWLKAAAEKHEKRSKKQPSKVPISKLNEFLRTLSDATLEDIRQECIATGGASK